uniref:ATP-dependent DNA helicase n=1 Tax=Oreochromis niloticus TaxID=8128 RepID=A0A669CYJ6_ORENI
MPRKSQRSQSQKLRWQKQKEAPGPSHVQVTNSESHQQVNVSQSSEQVKCACVPDAKVQQVIQTEPQVTLQTQHDREAPGPSHVQVTNSVTRPRVSSICASRSQASAKYGKYRNQQCMANSLVFLSFLHEDEFITRADLNRVLDKGHAVYSDARKRFVNSVFLACDELPTVVTSRRHEYQVDMSQFAHYGTFDGTDHLPSLEQGLQCLASEVHYALLVMGGTVIAVCRLTSGEYAYFDPHPRKSTGMPLSLAVSGGTAVMLKFTRLNDMTDRIKRLYRMFSIAPTCTYELQPVEFHSENAADQRDADENRQTATTVPAPALNEPEFETPKSTEQTQKTVTDTLATEVMSSRVDYSNEPAAELNNCPSDYLEIETSTSSVRDTQVTKESVPQNDLEALDWSEKCEILRSNPVTTMRMFDKRVEALFRDLLFSPAQPLGEIIDYFYRVEFQHRGSPHIHMLLWIREKVEVDVDDDQTVCDFVDRYISAQLPDPEKQPELHKKVTELQKHSKNHTKTCFKSVNSGCRFGFPKPPATRTMIVRQDEDSDTEAAKAKLRPLLNLLKEPEAASLTIEQILSRCNLTMNEYEQCLQDINKKTALILKRDPKDCWINNYNPDLLEAWNSNLDVSLILNAYSCIEYLCKYITKKESGLSEYLKTVIDNSGNNTVNECDEMRAVMQAYSKKREISAQECVTRVCGLKMKKCSRSVVFVPTDDNPVKMSRPMSYLESTTHDSRIIWMTSLSDKYKCRPETPEYEEMSLADFAALCRLVSGPNEGKDVLPLLNQLGFVQMRKNDKPAIIRYYHCSQEKDPEQYYGRLLRLYLPHRSEQELKPQGFQTYQSFYNSGFVRLPCSDHSESVKRVVKRNKDKYEKNSEDIESALEEFEQNRDVVIDEWCNLAPESEVVRLQCDENLPERHSDDENEQENVPDYSRQSDAVTEIRAIREQPAVDPAVVRVMYQNLNQKQACMFYAIRDWCIQRVCGLNPDPFFFYINGGAGTGKSHLIKCIHSEASKILSRLPANAEEADISNPTVLLTSFTGTAAFSINGSTLHSLLKLPRSLKPPIQGLGNQLDEVRSELINAEIIVIDEISMVSKPLFAYVDARLKQIKGTQRPFGGMSVLAVGDFYQLPPVRQSKPLCVYDPEQIDLWQEHFQMITLTEIMRQKDDVAFAEMLNRIRVKEKTDELPQCDKDLLSQAVTAPEECPIEVLHIYATNKNVESHNTDTLKKLHSNIIIINADDFQKDKCTGRMA